MKRIIALLIIMGLVFSSCGIIVPNIAEIEIKNVGSDDNSGFGLLGLASDSEEDETQVNKKKGRGINLLVTLDTDASQRAEINIIREDDHSPTPKDSAIFEIIWWGANTSADVKFNYEYKIKDSKNREGSGSMTVSDVKNFDRLLLTWETKHIGGIDDDGTVTQIKREKK